MIRPAITSINGKEEPWTPEIWTLWAQSIAGRWEGYTVSRANYFTPRLAVDSTAGFVYNLHAPNTCGVPTVWRTEWPEEYKVEAEA